jgi:hypothetical protein
MGPTASKLAKLDEVVETFARIPVAKELSHHH